MRIMETSRPKMRVLPEAQHLSVSRSIINQSILCTFQWRSMRSYPKISCRVPVMLRNFPDLVRRPLVTRFLKLGFHVHC
ncbi:hypothetical protein SCLCIDRAFT_907271 [Scleroderma citrinum Foug A]|uniref:Uncharacterized protein n=1 Tax=Scleroderma citrinum Foug A TaxID=1036808 RepID=A0A0C3DZJ9_9AGAM|nr:hypothetical protein SCLCIDRAFT_907271 [Scleroderma citrinum Foug A]